MYKEIKHKDEVIITIEAGSTKRWITTPSISVAWIRGLTIDINFDFFFWWLSIEFYKWNRAS